MVSQTLWDHKHIGRNIVTLTWSAPANCSVDYVEVIYVQQSISKYLYKTGGQEFISYNNGSFILRGNSGSQGFFAGGKESGECIVTARMYYHSNKANTTIAVDKLQYQSTSTEMVTFTLTNSVDITKVYHRLAWWIWYAPTNRYLQVYEYPVPIGDGQLPTFQQNPATYQLTIHEFLTYVMGNSEPYLRTYISEQQALDIIVHCNTYIDAAYRNQVGETQGVRFNIIFNENAVGPSFIDDPNVPFGWDDPDDGDGNSTVFHVTEGTDGNETDYYYYLCNITYINFHGTLNLKYGATARWVITNNLGTVNVQGTGSQINARVTSPTPGPQTFTITVYDSRGYSISVTSDEFTFIAYTPPTVVFSAARGMDEKDGDTMITKHNKCYGSITYTHTVLGWEEELQSGEIDEHWHNTATVTFSCLDLNMSGNTPQPYNKTLSNTKDALCTNSLTLDNPTFDATHRYRIYATVTDSVLQQLGREGAQYSVTIGTAGAYLHFRPDALGVGGYPTGDKMVYINDGWDLIYKGANIASAMYPVGSIYMSVNNTDPGILFPGTTWAKIEGKFLLAADSNHAVNSEGGSATQTLTVDQLPSHNHSLPETASTTSRWLAHLAALSTDTNNTNRWMNTTVKEWGDSDNNVLSSSGGPDKYEVFENIHTHTFSDPTGSTGSGSSISIMPPYLAVYMWQRTA